MHQITHISLKQLSGFTDKNVQPLQERDAEAGEAGLYLVDEFQFPHAVHELGENAMNEEDLVLAYRKLHEFLNLKTKPHLGITLVIAPEWMFLATISEPYHREQYLDIDGTDLEGGVPVYLDGFAYSGILNI